MTATATTYPARVQAPQFSRPPLLLLAALAIAVGMIGTIFLGSHATCRHMDDAEWVRFQLEQGHDIEFWRIEGTDKGYLVCTDLKGKFGIQAIIQRAENGWQEITSFIKNKMTKLADVERYLRNSGAKRIW